MTDQARLEREPAQDHGDRARITRAEERLTTDVARAQAGVVRIRRRTVEEPESVDVTLRHDELQLERRLVNRPLEPGEAPVAERGDTTVVLVIEERLEVQRVPWVVEEVHVRRNLVAEQQSVTDTVRRQRIDIETEGDIDLTSTDT